MRQAQLIAAVNLAFHPQKVAIECAWPVGARTLGAIAPQPVLDLHELIQQDKRSELGANLDNSVGKGLLRSS